MIFVAYWLLLFGVWPLLSPEHSDWTSAAAAFDLTLHTIGLVFVLAHLSDAARRWWATLRDL